jgi:hypothetical protein
MVACRYCALSILAPYCWPLDTSHFPWSPWLPCLCFLHVPNPNDHSPVKRSGITHSTKHGRFLVVQCQRGVVLYDLSILQHEDTVIVGDRCKPMRNAQSARWIGKLELGHQYVRVLSSAYRVVCLNSRRIVDWIRASVSGSTALVASSKRSTLRSFTNARQSAIIWRSPHLGFGSHNGEQKTQLVTGSYGTILTRSSSLHQPPPHPT